MTTIQRGLYGVSGQTVSECHEILSNQHLQPLIPFTVRTYTTITYTHRNNTQNPPNQHIKNNTVPGLNPTPNLSFHLSIYQLSGLEQEQGQAAAIAPPNRLLWIIRRCRPVPRGHEAVVMISDFLTRIVKVHSARLPPPPTLHHNPHPAYLTIYLSITNLPTYLRYLLLQTPTNHLFD